ncbi:hypothetical protein TKK_0000504 [Trichogramma kaykai]
MLNQWQVEIPEEASEALTLERFDAYLGRGVSVDCLIIKTQLEHSSIGWIDQAANVGERSTDGNAALHFAVLRKRRYLLEYLLRRGADLSIKNARGETALDMLLRSPHLAGSEEAFCNRQEHECDLEMLACLERWCLEAYGERHNLRQMHFRSAKKAQPHHHRRHHRGQRAQKCTKSDLNSVIGRDCPIWPGWTALHLAVVYGNCGEVKWLLDNGADPGVRDADGNTPLHFAPLNSTFNADLFSRLFVYDSDTFGGLNGLNHFHIACLNPKYIDVAREFLKRGHSPDTPARKGKLYYVDHDHWTPLHMAAKHSRIDLLKLLLEFNAKVDSRDQKECTAFHINVLLNRNVHCAKLLLEAGTDFETACRGCLKPLSLLASPFWTEPMGKVIVMHLKKLILLGQTLADDTLTYYRLMLAKLTNWDEDGFEFKCLMELTIVDELGLRPMLLLADDDDERLERYATKPELVELVTDGAEFERRFPIYGYLIRRKYKAATRRAERRRLLEEASVSLANALGPRLMNQDTARHILLHNFNNYALQNVIAAMTFR